MYKFCIFDFALLILKYWIYYLIRWSKTTVNLLSVRFLEGFALTNQSDYITCGSISETTYSKILGGDNNGSLHLWTNGNRFPIGVIYFKSYMNTILHSHAAWFLRKKILYSEAIWTESWTSGILKQEKVLKLNSMRYKNRLCERVLLWILNWNRNK